MQSRLARILISPKRLGQFEAAASYHEKVIDHYENPRNVGSLDKNDPSVGTGVVGAPACGDVMKLQIKVYFLWVENGQPSFKLQVDENGKIIDAKFKTFGCGSAIASSSLATEWIKGRDVDYAGKIKNQQIAKELSLPPVKLHCSSKWEWERVSPFITKYQIINIR
jgi:iron-sulfur cluster assembly enzyme ISCU, mitochondrial